jgi:hypothetical protein
MHKAGGLPERLMVYLAQQQTALYHTIGIQAFAYYFLPYIYIPPLPQYRIFQPDS